jgi:prephenate dehydrogenase
MGTPQLFEKLAIFGVGLIGGSVALALRAAGQSGAIVGVGRNGDGLQEAIVRGVVDRAEPPETAVQDADIVLLATPVGQFEPILRTIAPHVSPHVMITDAGSTKGDVVAVMRATLPRLGRCVPAHPIAGAEHSGVAAARAGLFQGKNVVLTPLAETEADALGKAEAFWQACGANLVRMTAEEHDRVFAAVSHLPHLLAFALVDDIARRPDAERILGFAAGGFRDFSRIASSSPEMWRDICLANRDALLAELDAYQDELMQLRRMLTESDGAGLEALFHRARQARNAWIRGFEHK